MSHYLYTQRGPELGESAHLETTNQEEFFTVNHSLAWWNELCLHLTHDTQPESVGGFLGHFCRHVGSTLYWLKTASLLSRVKVAVSRRHFTSALLLAYTLCLTVAHTGCKCPTSTLFRLMYLRVFLFLIPSLHVSSISLLIAPSTIVFHLLFVGWFSKGSEGRGGCIILLLCGSDWTKRLQWGFSWQAIASISLSLYPHLLTFSKTCLACSCAGLPPQGRYRDKPMT